MGRVKRESRPDNTADGLREYTIAAICTTTHTTTVMGRNLEDAVSRATAGDVVWIETGEPDWSIGDV